MRQNLFDVDISAQIGESGWAPPLPLESSNNNSQPDDVSTKPVLIRAQIPEWGTVHEVVARVEMAGLGFERTMVRGIKQCYILVTNKCGLQSPNVCVYIITLTLLSSGQIQP